MGFSPSTGKTRSGFSAFPAFAQGVGRALPGLRLPTASLRSPAGPRWLFSESRAEASGAALP